MNNHYLMMSINGRASNSHGDVNTQKIISGYDIVHRNPSQCVTKEVVSFTPAFNSEGALAEASRLISGWSVPVNQEITSVVE